MTKNFKINYSVLKMLPIPLPAMNANKNLCMCIECRYVCLFTGELHLVC